MVSLVKIQDLVNLVEPPLGVLSASPSVRQRQNDEMELDAGEEELKPSAQGGQDSPNGANIGLG